MKLTKCKICLQYYPPHKIINNHGQKICTGCLRNIKYNAEQLRILHLLETEGTGVESDAARNLQILQAQAGY